MSSETSTDQGFHASHFFVLLSLLAATVAVVLARPSAPENLILISLTIGAAGAAGYGMDLMLAPLVAARRRPGREVLSDRMRQDLEREKALTLRSIKELEFDRAMGKVSDKDFGEMSTRLRARAAGLIRQLDAGSGYRETIEKEIAKRVKSKNYEVPVVRGDCAACGTHNDPDAKFCKNCGARMEA